MAWHRYIRSEKTSISAKSVVGNLFTYPLHCQIGEKQIQGPRIVPLMVSTWPITENTKVHIATLNPFQHNTVGYCS